jgi:serine/threonine protein kinase
VTLLTQNSQCFFVITGAEWLHPNFDELETDAEPVILYKLLTAFGPLPKALVSHVDDEQGGALMEALWEAIKEEGLYEPFKDWSQNTFPNLDHEAKELISRMTNLDPAKRATMSEIMEDPY